MLNRNFWLFLLAIFGMVYLATTRFVSDSELWAIGLSNEIGNFETYHTTVYAKYIFYLILKIPYLFSLSSVEHIKFVRTIFALIASLNLYLIYLVGIKLNKNKAISLLLCTLICANYYLNTQLYVVRADVVSLSFCLVILNLIIENKWHQSKPKTFFLFLLVVLLFLTTPKSIYMILALTIATFVLNLTTQQKFFKKIVVLSAVVMPVFLLIIVSSYFFPAVYNGFYQALSFYVNGFSVNHLEGNIGWHFLFRFLKQCPSFVLLIGFCYIIVLFNFRKIALKEKAIVFFAATSLTVLLFHNQKLPYFIAVYVILACLIVLIAEKYINKNLLKILIVLAIAIDFTFFAPKNIWGRDGTEQFEMISNIEKEVFVKNPHWKYLDGVTSFCRSNHITSYIGPGDEYTNKKTIELVKSEKPEVIFYSTRMMYVEPEITMILNENYTQIKTGVFVAKTVFNNNLDINKLNYHNNVSSLISYWYP